MEFFLEEQCQQSLMDSACLPDSPAYVPFCLQGKTEEMSDEFFCFPSCFNQLESFPSASASFLTETFSSTTVKPEECCGKEREQENFSRQSTAQSKGKRRRTKNRRSEKKKMEEKQPPTDYIHVRARRGQATDSHSLAERVRRERISERMKVLQGLVPGCEKVTGKAPILDEIINYVESLKNQVEFLSMKLASVSPILYEFGFHFESFRSIPEILDGNPQLLPSMTQSRDIQSPSESFTVMSNASNPQGITAFPQDDGSFLMQNEELDFQADLYSIYSFQ